MSEFDQTPEQSLEPSSKTVSEREYRNAHYTLSAFADRFVGVDNADELMLGVVGLGHALDTVIRINGTRVPKRGLDNPGERYTWQIPLEPHRDPLQPDRGHLIATTDGRVVALFERPREPVPNTAKLPSQSTFLTLPVNDIDWKQKGTETPSLKIDTGEMQFPTKQPTNGLLQQVYAATLRQGVEKVAQVARPPQLPPANQQE